MATSSNSLSEGVSMSTKSILCPKCSGEMHQGFIADWGQGGDRRVSNWVQGAPEKSFWHHTSVPVEKCIPIGTFRCSLCGFLESYARAEFTEK